MEPMFTHQHSKKDSGISLNDEVDTRKVGSGNEETAYLS